MRDSRKVSRQLVVASALTMSAAWHRQTLRKATPELLWVLPVLVLVWFSLTYFKMCQSLQERLRGDETPPAPYRKGVT